MRKTILVCCLVLSLALVAGCGKKSGDTAETQEKGGKIEQAAGKFAGTMRDLMMRGEGAKCTYKMANQGFDQENTLYISGKKMRMDGVTKMAGQGEIKNHVIVLEDYQYFWNEDGTNTGFKMKLDAAASQANGDTFEDVQNQNTQIDLDMKLEMDCDRWSEDSGKFSPPGNIKFQDFSDMMKSFGNFQQ